jgi:anti-sigma regulatory factor (Ser/Thr protein kinase)
MTELVTNAVRHGDVRSQRSVRVEVRQWRDGVRVEVVDGGPGFEHVPPRPDRGESGWGLFLVGRVADRWGIRPAASGTCFEIGLR